MTGSVAPAALYLFAIVFYWTPPHFWALSLLMKDEYARVGVPMMPVVHGETETRRQIVLYTLLLTVLTLLPFVFGFFGVIYAVFAAGLGAAFIMLAVRLQRRADRASALRTYLFSLGLSRGAVRRDGRWTPACKTDRAMDRKPRAPQPPHRLLSPRSSALLMFALTFVAACVYNVNERLERTNGSSSRRGGDPHAGAEHRCR